jgi:hypothetical protein
VRSDHEGLEHLPFIYRVWIIRSRLHAIPCCLQVTDSRCSCHAQICESPISHPLAPQTSLPMAIPSASSSAIPDLTVVLERLGLTEYRATLFDNGFHNWETVVDITEDDMTTLHFKLGHRRLLQREIATYRGIPQSLSLESDTKSPEPTSLSTSALERFTRQTTTPPPREKRRYRRHPRPDSNAPKKPKTACTLCKNWSL